MARKKAPASLTVKPSDTRGRWEVVLKIGKRTTGREVYGPKRQAEQVLRQVIADLIQDGRHVEASVYGVDGELQDQQTYEPEGEGSVCIHRKGYSRKGHERAAYTRTTASGKRVRVGRTRVASSKVPPTVFCIKDVGTSGKRARGAKGGAFEEEKPWISRKGKLSKTRNGKVVRHFLKDMTLKEQKERLDRCVRAWGYRSCLGSIMALERSKAIKEKYGDRLAKLRRWLVDQYGGPGSFGPRR